MIRFNTQESLTVSKKPVFETLILKYKPEFRQKTAFGYEWIFPLEAFHDLIDNGFDWAVKKRITNKEDPNYGKEYVSIFMYHGKNSGLENLVKNGLDFHKNIKYGLGDKVKLLPSAPQSKFFEDFDQLIFTVIDYDGDKLVIFPESEEKDKLYLSVYPSHVKLVERSDYIKEHWNRLSKISEELNLHKAKNYYSLTDEQNGGQIMWTGLNSTSLDELRKRLLSYISLYYKTKPYDGWEYENEGERGYKDWLNIQKLSVFDLANMFGMGIVKHTQPFLNNGVNIDDETGGHIVKLNEGLNFPKSKWSSPKTYVKNILNQLKPYRSHQFPDTIYYRKDGIVYMEYHIPTKTLMYSLLKFTDPLRQMGFNYEDVAPFMKEMFEEVFGLPVKKSRNDSIVTSIWWDGIKDWYPDQERLQEELNLSEEQVQKVLIKIHGNFELTFNASDDDTLQPLDVDINDQQLYDFVVTRINQIAAEVKLKYGINLTFPEIKDYSLSDSDNVYIKGLFKVELITVLKNKNEISNYVKNLLQKINKQYGLFLSNVNIKVLRLPLTYNKNDEVKHEKNNREIETQEATSTAGGVSTGAYSGPFMKPIHRIISEDLSVNEEIKKYQTNLVKDREKNDDIDQIIQEEMINLYNKKKGITLTNKDLEDELDEGTDIASVGGGVNGPGFAYIDPYGKGYQARGTWAKNESSMYHGKKPWWKGGSFVTVKEKCKKFPYCNQGDTGALNFSNPAVAHSYNMS